MTMFLRFHPLLLGFAAMFAASACGSGPAVPEQPEEVAVSVRPMPGDTLMLGYGAALAVHDTLLLIQDNNAPGYIMRLCGYPSLRPLYNFVVKGKGPVPTRFPHEGKRSLRDFVDLAAKEKEVGIEQAVSAVLNQEIESLFVNVKWSEIAALNETQRQFALFVLQMEAAMHSFVEVQIERRIDEELDLGPLEEKTLDVMEDVISILYSLSASPRRREEIRRLQKQCYCTIWHVCFKEMSAILEQCQTAEELLQQQQTAFLTTGCRSIDKCLKGGIPLHSITEVCGLLVCILIF